MIIVTSLLFLYFVLGLVAEVLQLLSDWLIVTGQWLKNKLWLVFGDRLAFSPFNFQDDI